MKRVFLIILSVLIASAVSYKNKYRLRNKKFELMFSTENLNKNPNETPQVMENIFKGKAVGISSKMQGQDEIKKVHEQIGSSQNSRFKESAPNNSINLENMESPRIVKNLGTGYDQFNLQNRLALMTPQRVTNRQAYDIVYNSHQDYYKDRQIRVFDNNFEQMENYLIKEFKEGITKAIDFKANKNLQHVADLDRRTLNVQDWNTQERVPYINQAAFSSPKYENQLGGNSKEYTTDPYGATIGR